MEGKKSFVLYVDQRIVFDALTDEQRGKLMSLIFDYVSDLHPETTDPILNIAFASIKQTLKRDLISWKEKIAKRSQSGHLGGIKSGEARRSKTKQVEANEANASKSKQNEANEAVNVNENVNVNVNDINTKREKKTSFLAPTVSDVISYFDSNGYSEVSARRAHQYYELANWHDSTGKKVKNWKQKMQAVWFKPENQKVAIKEIKKATTPDNENNW